MTTINRKQPMRPAEIDLLNQVDTNTADIATQTARLTQEFGTSNAIDVQANSNTSIDINFGSTKTKVPIVLCGLQHASDDISYIITGVTNQQFSVTVYNHSSTNVSGITIDWLAISGR